MITSQRGIDLIKKFEQCVLHAYRDSAGIWTIGYGTICYPDGKPVKEGHLITLQKAEDYLRYEVKKKEMGVNTALINTKVNQNQFDALVSFAYNVGTAGLAGSTLIKKVRNNPGDPTIRDSFLMWNKITKNGKKVELEGLTKRRAKEADLYFEPIPEKAA